MSKRAETSQTTALPLPIKGMVEVYGYTGRLLGWSEGKIGKFWPTPKTANMLADAGIELDGKPGR